MPQTPNPYDFLPQVPNFSLHSNDLAHGEALRRPQLSGILGAGGEDRSPHLAWTGFPEGTKGFAVTCFDPDAPTASGFWHWAVFNIPASTTELQSDAGNTDSSKLPAGAITLAGDSGHAQFVGAAPPPEHGPHRYFFVVHAVDVESLEIDPQASPAVLGFTLFGHTLGRATIVGTYENKS